MTRSHWLCLWLSCSKILDSLILIAVSFSMNLNFICALLCVAKPSRSLIKEDTRFQGSEFQRKMGSGIMFDEIETDIGTCFPIHFVVLVPSYVSSLTQLDSKSKTVMFQNKFSSSLYGILK